MTANGVPPPAQTPGGGSWKFRLALLVTPHVFGTINLAAIAAMAPIIKQDLGLTLAEIGLLSTAYTVCQAVAGLPSGVAVDRLGIGWTLFLGFVFLTAGALVFSQADGLTLCLVGAGVMGVGYACMNPSTMKAAFDWFPRNRRGTVVGLKQSGVPVGWAAGAFALPLAAIVDWHTILLALAAVCFAVGLIYLPMAKRPKTLPGQKRPLPFVEIAALLRNWNLNALEFHTFLYHAAQQNVYSFTTLFFREALHASSWHASLALQLVQGGSVIARIGIGLVSDFLLKGRRKPVAVTVCFAAALLCLAAAFLRPGEWGILVGLGVFFLLGIAACSASPIHQAMVVETVPPRLAGTAMSYHVTTVPAGKAVGPPVFGLIADQFAYSDAWLMTGLGVLIAGVVLTRYFKEQAHEA